MDAFAGQVVKGYELVEEIGAGGFGAVYRAFQPTVGREVAIKIILPEYANNAEFVRRFEAEAQLVARLEHLHIVPLYDYWREPGGAYLVMRYLRGGNARDVIQNQGAWNAQDVSVLLEQITSALAVAHRNQVIHRDLKPDNILMDESGNYFLADFGIAKDMSGTDDVNSTGGPIIGSPAYFSPEQIRGLSVTEQTDVYSLGICLYELLTSKHPYEGTSAQGMVFKHLTQPVPDIRELRPDLPDSINEIIQSCTDKEPEERYPDVYTVAAAFRQAIGALSTWHDSDEDTMMMSRERVRVRTTPAMGMQLPEPENPYKGLRAFRESDSDDFFGRETLVRKLVDRLDEKRLLTVVGPSGSGKSSVVHAGLVPALRRGALTGSRSWFYVVMHPDDAPLRELENALMGIATNPPGSLMAQLVDNERGLMRALKRTLPDDDSELVLVIDQFEETFTLVPDKDMRLHFLQNLMTAVQDPRSRIRVILTLRADFYDRPLLYAGFGELIRETTEVVLPLNRQELERAITAPAERVGLLVEPQLVNAILKDVGEATGALPLMQYALTELYEMRDGRMLTLESYRQIGGVSGALAQRAEDLYWELPKPTRIAAEQIFLRLVNLGEGTEDTRRRALQSELMTLNPSDEEHAVEDVLDQYGKYRLLTFDRDPETREPTIELAHEALIREWALLRKWLEESREDVRTQRRLSAGSDEWISSDQDASFLLTGTRLDQFREWRNQTGLTLNEQELAYLEASFDADEARIAAEIAQQQREEALEERARQRLQLFLIVSAIAAVFGIGLSIFAFNQRNVARQNALALGTAVAVAESQREVAERNAAEANSLALAASAQQALTSSNTELAIALALEANRLDSPPAQSQRVLAQAIYAPGTRQIFTGHTNYILGLQFSRDGSTVASASADGTLRLWDVDTGETLQRFSGHTAAVNDVDISPNGLQIVSASADGSVRLWDVESGSVLQQINTDGGALSVEYSPDGLTALIGDASGNVHIWNLVDDTFTETFAGHDSPIYDTAFSPRGRTFVSAAGDGTMRVWNVQAGTELRRILGHEDRVLSVAFSPGGIEVVSGGADNTIRAWDVRFGGEVRQYFGHSGAINSVAVTPDGLRLISASDDQTIRVWDMVTSEEILRLRGHSAGITTLAVSPDGRMIVSGARDNTIRLWDLRSGAEVLRFADSDDTYIAVEISSDDRFVLTGSRRGGLETWNLETGESIRTLSTIKGTVSALEDVLGENLAEIALSPNNRLAASGSRDGQVTVWDVNSGTDLRRLGDHTAAITALAFTPDNRRLLSASLDASVILTDIGSGDQIYRRNINGEILTQIVLLPDSDDALVGTNSGKLFVIDLADASIKKTFGTHLDAILSIDINDGGTLALTGSEDRTLRLWDLTQEGSTSQLLRMDGHEDSVTGVSLSSDGLRAISTSADNTLRVWRLDTGEAVQVLEGHRAAVTDVAYLSNDQLALAVSEDGTVRLWQTLSLAEQIVWVRENRYQIELDCAQREQFRVLPYCEDVE